MTRSDRDEPKDRPVPNGVPAAEDGDATAGSPGDDATPRDPATVASLFSLLGEEIRVRILEELAAARRTDSGGLSFSTLRERVGVEDSGRFNYHLGRLAGRLVEKDDGVYALTPAGRRLVGSLSDPSDEPTAGTSGLEG